MYLTSVAIKFIISTLHSGDKLMISYYDLNVCVPLKTLHVGTLMPMVMVLVSRVL